MSSSSVFRTDSVHSGWLRALGASLLTACLVAAVLGLSTSARSVEAPAPATESFNYDPPAPSTTAPTNVRTAPLRSYDVVTGTSSLHTPALSPRLAAKGGGRADDLLRAAQKKYPRKAGNIEQHHVTPKYLGGDPKGATVPLDAAYHQEITNAFRELHPYGSARPSPDRLDEIMSQVYDRFPLGG